MKKKNYIFTKKLSYFGGAAVLLVGLLVTPGIASRQASAAEATTRSIEMSDSTAGDTGVTYAASFNIATAGVVQGMVVDFCGNDPLIGDACTAPTGFSLGASPSATTNLSGTWAATTNGSAPYHTLFLTNASGPTTTSGQTVTITISGVTNPSTANQSFYARILTYASSAAASSYVAGSEGSYIDDGGLALSTAIPVDITAKVMETLSFCVYHTTCGDDPSLNIGHGTDTVLDSTAVDTATDDFSIATNAGSGVNVRMKGGTLTSGSNTIPAAGSPSGSATPAAIVPGTAAFGMYILTPGADITPTTTYAGGSGDYGLDTTNLASTYGDSIATLSGPVNSSVTTMQFGATASNTTPAGIYTTSEELIATATF